MKLNVLPVALAATAIGAFSTNAQVVIENGVTRQSSSSTIGRIHRSRSRNKAGSLAPRIRRSPRRRPVRAVARPSWFTTKTSPGRRRFRRPIAT